jgi:hypothetical protein
VLTLIRQARRRFLRNELFCQCANAFSAALIGFILLLLLGTQILSWEFAAVIPVAAAAYGIFRATRRTPEPYRLAQLIDQRLSLADTLSTAYFFSQGSGEAASDVSGEVRRIQLQRAEQLAPEVDLRHAIPYTIPRTAYLMAALLLVASSLFALRYGISRRLDLKPPLAQMLQEQFGWKPKPQSAKDNRHKKTEPPQGQQDDPAVAADDQKQQNAAEPEQAQNSDSDMAGQQQADNKDAGPKGDQKQQAENGDKKNGDEGDAQAEEKSDSSGEPSENGQQGENGKQEQAQSGNKQDANSGDNSSLLSKVKDAVQNLLSKVKPQQGSQGSQQQAADQGQKQQGEAQDGQPGDEAKNSQDQQGKGAGKSDTQQSSKQPGSGIGSQDGDKSIKQAEQLAAMGKISEILGKRSANITGESTVEVQNTSQQLKTQYVQRGAQHSQGGAEISRDEIPVALQSYVEQYFEQVRKQAPAVKKQ